ncbi:MAG: SDR family oxidoreductase [Rhodospirillaceae bacterium]|nr:SDR family oxidoreductase [Rhodospirillaceae bacterium]MBT6138221.1 SDR family oxidoreductase [Rhodospirillaceae bacterium]
MTRTALVVGASGITGRNLIDHLLAIGGWEIIGLSRANAREESNRYRHISVDITDQASSKAALSELRDVTHIFYAARNSMPDLAAEARSNRAMLENVLVPVEAAAGSGLSHLHLMHGAKWYGSHLGAYKVPAREDDPRLPSPNFYYEQQDLAEQRQADAMSRDLGWTWSSLRPHILSGFSVGYPHNSMGVLAAYGALCREEGRPLDFPGTEACFEAISQTTDAGLLSRAMVWCATAPEAANEAFNIINGDYFRWMDVWPLVADFFAVPIGEVRTQELARTMVGKDVVWDAMRARAGLQPLAIDQVATWAYGDFQWSAGWHDMSSTIKLHRHGFHEMVDTEEMIVRILGEYRERGVIP